MRAGWKLRIDERIYFEQKKKVKEILLRDRQRLEMEIHVNTMRRIAAGMANTAGTS